MLKIEIDREVDGRWIAEVRALSGVIADRIEHGEPVPDEVGPDDL